ncbi:translation initiation factor eIF 4e-like domain-containing protein [Phycomyces nitens]|nr:translation initiation factor eIF 4e-like domain-containing protein [Phycomyces nitens]
MTDIQTRPVHQAEETVVADNNAQEKPTDAADDNSITTVFHDRSNYNVKHPLQNTWTLWFDNPGKKANTQSWSQNLKEIVSIDTVEDFWGVYNNISRVNRLDVSSNFHFFKKGVRPEWEDPMNAEGGKFGIQFPRNRTGEAINDYWLHLLLAMIGEQFAKEDEICGAVVSVRKVFFRVALWVKHSEKTETLEALGRQVKEVMNVPNNIPVEFTPHGETPSEKAVKFTVQ